MLAHLLEGILALSLACAPDSAPREAGELARAARDRGAQPVDTRRVVIEGTVHLPGGAPAEGAVVVSSAGGQAVTDALGRYVLEIEVAADALETRVTAVNSGHADSRVASVTVDLRSMCVRLEAGRLDLQGEGGCEPDWLPTFGQTPDLVGTTFPSVQALAILDNGSDTALYAAGNFTSAGGASASYIA